MLHLFTRLISTRIETTFGRARLRRLKLVGPQAHAIEIRHMIVMQTYEYQLNLVYRLELV